MDFRLSSHASVSQPFPVSSSLTLFCPAKINPYLAVTGRRDDGFHELLSLVVPITVGDTLEVTPSTNGVFSMQCDDQTLPTDESNLVIKAARSFRQATGWTEGAHFSLRKTIPSGAGLGGGSSDAVGALKALNEIAGRPLSKVRLAEVAAEVGSDCPLFLETGAVVMRGRGERVTLLEERVQHRFSGRSLVVIKPPFGINTGWAYGQLKAGAPSSYLEPKLAENRLSEWLTDSDADLDSIGSNSFMPVVSQKFLAISVFSNLVQRETGHLVNLSGSGSACFVWTRDGPAIRDLAEHAWGSEVWVRAAEPWLES